MFYKMVAAQGEEKEMDRTMWGYIPPAPMASAKSAFQWFSDVLDYPPANPELGFSYYTTQRLSLIRGAMLRACFQMSF